MGKRTKKDVDDAYQRGYEEGFTEAERMLNPFRIFLRSVWRKHALKKYKKAYLKKAYLEKAMEDEGGANGSGAQAN